MIFKSLRKIKMEIICPPKLGEIVEGKVLEGGRSSIFIDLGIKGIGIIYGKEFIEAKDILKNLKVGDNLLVKIIELETEDGYRGISLTQASKELVWEELKKIQEEGNLFEVQIKGANRGGLTCQVKNIPAFLPVSQLSHEHYPRVKGADPLKIASELQKFVGASLKVRILDTDAKNKKLILSEKTRTIKKENTLLKEKSINQVGNIVEGEISGITNFGAFLKFGDGLEGLIRRSDFSASAGKGLGETLQIGQKKKAKIIEIINNRIYLSLKITTK